MNRDMAKDRSGPATAAATTLPFSVKIGWALGQLPIASHIGVASFYLLYFLTDVHHIPPAWAGVALLLPRLFNMFFDPVMGSLSDRTRTRFGRRRPYLLGGSLVWGLAFTLLFGLPVLGDPRTGIVLLFGAFMLVTIGQTLYHVPYSAMLAEMTRNSRDRISLASWKESVSRIGILIAATTTPILVAWFASEALGYRVAGLVFGAVIIFGGLVAFKTTAKAPSREDSVHVAVSYRAQFQAMLDNRPFCLLVIAYVCIMAADELFSSSLVFYAVNVLGQSAAFVGKVYPISSIAAICTIPAWNGAAVRLGKKTALLIAIAGMAATWLCLLAIPPSHAWIMYPLMAISGAFNAGLLLLPNAMVPDTVEYDAHHSGHRREGAIYGAWIFCQQSAMAAGGFMLSISLGFIGYNGAVAVQPASVHHGLAAIISIAPAVLLAIAALLVRAYPLNEERVQALGAA
ncbi:MAG TPA: glycoside-pentoside-hexuronide (GPH):cation symporter [Caulobacter sp.]|nr:glycoside-pentoside-hexuronide (GPH):cation symporter [Caulobacter sp.]